jgi:uncharacterized protein (TIRG00374 family)
VRKGGVLGIAITVVCLGLAFYKIDYEALYRALAEASYLYLIPAAVCTLAGYVVRTGRWRVLLAESAACSFGNLFGILMAGFATNNVLPARLGELARAYLLRRRSGVRKTYLLASVFMERLFDGLVLVGLLATLSMLISLPGWGRDVELFARIFFLVVTLGVVLLLAKVDFATRALAVVLWPFPTRFSKWASAAFAAFVLGLGTMRRPAVLGRAAGLSLIVWLLEWASYYVLSAGFDLGLSDARRAAACALLLAVVNLGIMLPSSPGYVGTFQFFAVAALSVFGVSREAALAFAIVAHLSQFVLVTTIGMVYFAREHVSLRSITSDVPDDTPVEVVRSGAVS